MRLLITSLKRLHVMANICVYGTVYTNAGTVEESIRSVWKPEYEIVIVDNYSTDGTWEKLLKLKKEYNLRLYRYKCSRGLGRNIALHKCPKNSLTAYFDLDTKYNYAFHRIIEAAEVYGSASAHALVAVDRGYAIRRGGWRDLNVTEDTDFAVRMYPRIHVPVVVGENANQSSHPTSVREDMLEAHGVFEEAVKSTFRCGYRLRYKYKQNT